jgi:peroxiredoxin/rhodanese-related sulfurtransferase
MPLPPARLLLALLPVVFLAGCGAERPSEPSVAPSERTQRAPSGSRTAGGERALAPDFTLETPAGEPFALADYRGRVVIVNFWATWCLPCVVEIPEFVELQEELADQGVQFVGVSQDSGPGMYTDVRDFGEMFSVNFPLVMDPGQRVGRAYNGAATLPTTVVVDPEGYVHARHVGLLSRHALLHMLEGLVVLPEDAHEGHDHATPLPAYDPTPGRTTAVVSEPRPLSPSEAGRLFHTGAMVVDLRTEPVRSAEGSIPYALPLSLAELDASALPANLAAPVLFVGSDDDEARAAAHRAARWGYGHARPLEGGFAAWKAAGLPVEGEPVVRGVRS